MTKPTVPARVTVYTHRLAGATLDQLLEAADDDRWPNSQCMPEWELLRNWAIQTESLMLDEAENLAWEQQMRELLKRELPYTVWIAARGAALAERTRARKLAQARMRDRYGYKRDRRHRLIARDVQALYRRWADS